MKRKRKKATWIKRLSVAALTAAMAVNLLLADSLATEVLAASPLAAPKIAVTASAAKVNPVSKQLVTWDCIWFGTYPQREVVSEEMSGYEDDASADSADSNVAKEVIVSTDVYEFLADAGNEGEWSNNQITWNGESYRRVKQADATYRYFKYEPIKWRVLSVSDNQATLLADIVLDNGQFNSANVAVTWEESISRSWLNGTFINDSFTNVEQTAIQVTEVANLENYIWKSVRPTQPTTSDKVFLPSQMEAYTAAYGFSKNYYTSIQDEARRCKSSAYAKAMGVSSSTVSGFEGNCAWWCRTVGRTKAHMVYVDAGGFVYNDGDAVNKYYGIRPAMTVDLSVSDVYYYAGTVSSDGTEKEISIEASIVRTQLDALPAADAVMLASEEEILAAREAYNGLTEEQQGQIEAAISGKLTAAEERLAELKRQVTDARERLSALPEIDNVTLADEEAASAADEAYNILTEEQKAQIDDALPQKLAAVLEKLAVLELPVIAMQEKMEELPKADDVTLGSEDMILAARAAYEALTEDAKEWAAIDLTKLTAAEEKLASLKQEMEAVQEQISALPETDEVMLANEEAINEAVKAVMEAYEALTEEQQGRIDLAKLTAVSEKLDELKQEIVTVQALIDALPAVDDVTLDSEAAIKAAKEAYEKLTSEQKEYVTGYDSVLVPADEKLVEIKLEDETENNNNGNDSDTNNTDNANNTDNTNSDNSNKININNNISSIISSFGNNSIFNSTYEANNSNNNSNTNNTSLASSFVKLNVSKAPLQIKKSTTAIKVASIKKGDKVVSWESSDTKVATVTSKGKIKALKVGKATITVTTKNGAKASCTITVQKAKVKTKSLKVSTGAKLALKKGKKATITVTRNPITATEKITCQSSDIKVATVTKKGVVKAKGKGNCKITVKSSNGKKKVIKVTVK